MKNKLRNTAVALIAVAVLAVSVPSALAYFSDYKEAQGKVQIFLTPEPESYEYIVDGYKKLVIKNNDTAMDSCWVRARAFGTDDHMTYEVDAAYWDFNAEDGWYYYKTPLAPGEETKADTFNVKVSYESPDDPEAIDLFVDEFNIVMVYESTPVLYEGTPDDPKPYADWSIEYIQRGGE